jgi:RNA polymerase sigma factor (sigma-70 family)
MSTDPERLLAAASAGDRASLERVLELHLPQLHAYVRARLGGELEPRESSVDVVQSVCRQILAARGDHAFDSEDHFRAWLFTAAVNKIREKVRFHRGQRRARGREQASLDHDLVPAAALLASPSQVAIGNETAQAVVAALAALPPDYREVVSLARIVRLPHRVIAEVMGRSEPAVRKLLGRAMLDLASELQRRGVDMEAWHGA